MKARMKHISASIPEKADRPYSERVLRNLAAGITQDQTNRLLLARFQRAVETGNSVMADAYRNVILDGMGTAEGEGYLG